jgi:hypothetical protein
VTRPGVAASDILVDAFDRVRSLVHKVVDGLTPEQLAFRADERANSIGWLVWHLTRVQDDHVADAAGADQVWTGGGWSRRFGLPFDPAATGYGHGSGEVAAVRVPGDLLVAYHEAVHARTLGYVGSLSAADLARIVDASWDPPVSLAVRLVSVIGDDLQHAGQAAFVRGLLERRPG